jgi:hypothetical protein
MKISILRLNLAAVADELWTIEDLYDAVMA